MCGRTFVGKEEHDREHAALVAHHAFLFRQHTKIRATDTDPPRGHEECVECPSGTYIVEDLVFFDAARNPLCEKHHSRLVAQAEARKEGDR